MSVKSAVRVRCSVPNCVYVLYNKQQYDIVFDYGTPYYL